MEGYSQEIIDNIKPEPEIKEVKIVLRKFDRRCKTESKMFETYFACGNCDYATKLKSDLCKHKKSCKILQKCENCFLMSKSIEFKKCIFCDLKFDCSNCQSNHVNQDHRK